MPANYNDSETCNDETLKDVPVIRPDFIDSRTVKVRRDKHWSPYAIGYNIQRTYCRRNTLKELSEKVFTYTNFAVEQLLSADYVARATATYLKAAVMGGHYYSMEKAVAIVNSSSIDEERKGRLVRALDLVAHHRGIHKAKLVHQNSEATLREFINNLDALVKLGVNPVTIPIYYKVDQHPNPILKLGQQGNRTGDDKNEPPRISVYEYIGSAHIRCRI
jgi:hypothetical protein